MGNVFVEENSLQDIANAIREKNGTDTKYLPSEMGGAVRDIQSGGISPIDYISQFFNIENKEEWIVGEFTLLSDEQPQYLTVANPAGKIPKDILVITKDIERCRKISDEKITAILIGGYNHGNTKADSDSNRTIILERTSYNSLSVCFKNIAINRSLWNFINDSCPSVGTSEMLYFRTAGGNAATTWYAGEYYVAVRA